MLGVRCWSLIVGDSGGNKSRQLVLCAVAGNFSGMWCRKFFLHLVAKKPGSLCRAFGERWLLCINAYEAQRPVNPEATCEADIPVNLTGFSSPAYP